MNTISSVPVNDRETKFTLSGKEYSLSSVIGSRLTDDPGVLMAGSRVINDLEIIVRTKENEKATECLKRVLQGLEMDVDTMLKEIQE